MGNPKLNIIINWKDNQRQVIIMSTNSQNIPLENSMIKSNNNQSIVHCYKTKEGAQSKGKVVSD